MPPGALSRSLEPPAARVRLVALPPVPETLHPVLVHFTIGLIPTAAAFATMFAWKGTQWTRPAAYATLSAAALLALLTMGSGFRDYFALAPALEGTAARDVMEWHERLGVVTAVTITLTALVAWWRRANVAANPRWRWALAAALLAASMLVGITGWYGGSLVYDHGVAVTLVP